MNIVWRRLWAPDARDPAWKSDGQTKRPVLKLPVSLLVVHYAGAPDGFPPGNQFLSVDSLTYMRNMWTWAFGAGEKGDEYNYVIAGTEGTVYEWAGLNRAAHCSFINDTSIGVQFGLDVDDIPPLAYAARLIELRQHLVEIGALTKDHRVDQHGEHFATGCPGDLVKARWPMYDCRLEPLQPTPPPQPPVNQEDAVFWKVTDHPEYQGLAVIFQETAPDIFVHVGASDAARYAGRAGTTPDVWANGQQPYPGGWAAFKPKFFPRP